MMNPLNVSIPDAANILAVGRSTVYELLNDGRLKSVKIGSRRLVTVASVKAFAENLEAQGA